MKCLCILLALLQPVFLVSENIKASVSIPKEYNIKLESKQLLFGTFFEFLNEFINGEQGLWSQEIYDRGFDDERNNSFGAVWKSYNANNGVVSFPIGGYNENGNSYVNISSEVESTIGIYQSIYLDTDIGEEFYIYLRNKSQSPSVFKLIISEQSNNQILFEKTIEVSNSEWEKYSFDIPAFASSRRVNVVLALEGAGSIDLDEVSLMPANNIDGVRKEFFDMFAAWKPGILRYPGGYFADTKYSHLDYSIGHIDQRKSPQYFINNYQRFDFGMPEFMKFCENIEAQAHIVVNLVDGSAEEAANWVEYCNGDVNSLYGSKRAADGHSEKYNVIYWEIGNEQWNDPDWMLPRYIQYYNAMKAKDSKIKCIIDGDLWQGETYYNTLMQYVSTSCENYGWHLGIGINKKHLGKMDSIATYYKVLTSNYSVEQSMKHFESYLIRDNLFPNCKQSITEHIYLWGEVKGWQDTIYRNSTLEAGLYQAGTMLSVMRNASSIELYEKTFGIGHIRIGFDSEGKRIIYPTPFHTVLEFLSNHSGDEIYIPTIEVPNFRSGVFEDSYQIDVPYLDALASKSKDFTYFYFQNRSFSDSLEVSLINTLDIEQNSIQAFILNSPSIYDFNTPEEPNKIHFQNTTIDDLANITLAPHSFYVIIAKNKPAEIKKTPENDWIKFFNNTIHLDSELRYNEITLFNQLGQLVYSSSDNTLTEINISDLPAGSYHILINCGKGNLYKSIINF